jgi:hypothetical protein
MTTIPELEPHCGSWICTQNDAVREVYERATAEKLAARGWRVLTAAQYLAEFNRGVKLAAERRAALASFDAEFLTRRG